MSLNAPLPPWRWRHLYVTHLKLPWCLKKSISD